MDIMPIWKEAVTLEGIRGLLNKTMPEYLGMEITEIGDDFLRGTMPVDHRTHQPYGILHGGASVALAETLGSLAAAFCTDREHFKTVGMEINANHIRPVRAGIVTGTARAVHLGRKSQVWEIKIVSEDGKLVNISRLTTLAIPNEGLK